MCDRCNRFNYRIESQVLKKSVSFQKGHLHGWKYKNEYVGGWAVDRILLGNHIGDFDAMVFYAWDRKLFYSISLQKFLSFAILREDQRFRDGTQQFLVPDKYWDVSAIAKIPHAYLDEAACQMLDLANRHRQLQTWAEKNDSEWLNYLTEEFLELHLALNDAHTDPPDLELLEIASIALNWLRRRKGPST